MNISKEMRPAPTTAKVSVIIPSIGRRSLSRAVRSVREQVGNFAVEIIVVFDLPDDSRSTELRALAPDAVIVLFTGGRRRGGHARNRGVQVATGGWIAFLDDDDAWLSDKLAKQLSLASSIRSNDQDVVIGCRVAMVSGDSRDRIGGVPARLISQNEQIEDYLFRKRRPGSLRASFFTSTILVSASLARAVEWREDLARHQDWDWLVRVGRSANVAFGQVPNDLVLYSLGSPGSVSASGDWASSLSWAERELRSGPKATYVDFLAGQPLRYALQARSVVGVKNTVEAIRRMRVMPSVGPVLIAAGGLLPRKALQRVMSIIR